MTQGVTARVAAMSFTPRDKITAGKVGRPDQGVTRTAKATGVSQTVMTRAFLVMEYASDLAQPVIDGELQLNAAYGTVSAPCSTPALVISVSQLGSGMCAERTQPELVLHFHRMAPAILLGTGVLVDGVR